MNIKVITEQESQWEFPLVQFIFDGVFQYDVKNLTQLDNIALWALENYVTDKVLFRYATGATVKEVSLGTTGDYPHQNAWDICQKQMAKRVRLRRREHETDQKND